MANGDTNRIYRLAEEYITETSPHQLKVFDSTWKSLVDEGLIKDSQKIYIDYPEDMAVISITGEEIDIIATTIIIGVITNAIYDLLLVSGEKAIKLIKSRKKRKKVLNEMGIRSNSVIDIGDRCMVWVLIKINNKEQR